MRNALWYRESYYLQVELNEQRGEAIDLLTQELIEADRERGRLESQRDAWRLVGIIGISYIAADRILRGVITWLRD